MNIINYVTELLGDSTPGGILALSILGIVGAFALGGALHGLRKGTGKMIWSFFITAIALAGAVLVTGSFSEVVISIFDGKSVKDAILLLEDYNIKVVMEEDVASLLDCFDAGVVKDIAMVPVASLVLPVLFVILFIVLWLIMALIGFIISLIAGLGKRKGGCLGRLVGMVIGAVRGVVVSAVILFPVMAFLTVADSAVTLLRDQPEENESAATVVELYDTYLSKSNESPVIEAMRAYGGGQLYDRLAHAEIGGKREDTRKTINSIIILWTKSTGINGMDWRNLTPENKSAIDDMVLEICNDEYLSTSAAGILGGLAKAVNDGVISIQLEEPYGQLIKSAIAIFSDTSSENFKEDITTFKEIYFILSDSGVLAAFELGTDATLEALTAKDPEGVTVINKLISTLRQNERTTALVEMLAHLSVSIMAGELGLDDDSLEKFEDLKGDLNGVLAVNSATYDTEEEKAAAVTDALNEALIENNIQLSDDVVGEMTDYLINNVEPGAVVTDEIVFDVIFSYYDAYLSAGTN